MEGSLSATVRAIWDRHRVAVMERIAVLERAATAASAGELGEEERRRAGAEAHRLAGSLGTFGFGRGSVLAREAEALLGASDPLDEERAARLGDLAGGLREELADDGGPEADPARAGGSAEPVGTLLVVDDDPRMAERLAPEATARGMRIVTAESPAAARAAIARQRPAATLLDLGFPEGGDEALRLLEELGAARPPLPTLVLTVSDGFDDRVEVARRGGRAFLEKSLRPQQVLDEVMRVIEAERGVMGTVLVVDDDAAILEAVGALLLDRGLAVNTLSDPACLWNALGETQPDIVVLDIDMPGSNGIELCRVIRNDPRYSQLPVLFLTAKSDPASVEEVFAAGADDYVRKPVVGPELVTRIENRLERTRLYRELAERDGLTGLLNRRAAEQSLDRFLRTAARSGQPMSVALLDLDGFKRVNDRIGHSAGDALLRRISELLRDAFRGEDVVARWGGDEFVVGMYGMRADQGVRRLTELLERARATDPDATFSAGVACLSRDGADLRSLLRAADEALYRVKAAGGNRAVMSGWHPEPADEPLDVLLVEDDHALVSPLLRELEARGYRSCWLADGREAVATLTSPNGAGPPRVAILGGELLGENGLAVLRRMAAAGSLDRTRVIVLTESADDGEEAEALELGAFDHVAKPFSTPVLLNRVRRALTA